MASSEMLAKLADHCIVHDQIAHGSDKGMLTDQVFIELELHLHGLTDIYAILQKYVPYKQMTFRLISDDQHKLIRNKIKVKFPDLIKGNVFIYIALNLQADENPADLIEGEGWRRMLLGVM